MPIIGIMRNVSQSLTASIAGVFYESGLTNLEITMNSDGAEDNIALLSKLYSGKLNFGAGTVCTMGDLERAIDAGANYIVTPVVNDEVIIACAAQKIPVFPGAYTPTEIFKAWNLGATMVKVFPATSLGTGFIKEVLGPLSHVKLVPTGGITTGNFTDYLAAGAKAVGIGSHLFPKDIIEQEDWAALGGGYSTFIQKYDAHVSSKQ